MECFNKSDIGLWTLWLEILQATPLLLYTQKEFVAQFNTCAVGVPKTPLQNLDLVWFISSFVTSPRYFVTKLTVNIAKLKVARV